MQRTTAHPWLRGLVVLIAVLAVVALPAQAVLELSGEQQAGTLIVAGSVADEGTPKPLFQAVWRGVPGAMAVFQLQRTAITESDVRLMLDRLVEAAIGTYLDERVHFTKHGVKADLPVATLVQEIDALVRAAAEDLGAEGLFNGLSGPTRAQLDRLTRIDWSQARFGIDGGNEQDKYLAIYYYVRSQRQELERQLRADLLPLAEVVVLGPPTKEAGRTVQINSTCGTVFDEANYLCALDLQLADTGAGGVDPQLGAQILEHIAERKKAEAESTAVLPAGKVRKRDLWLKGELNAINERMDKMDQRKELWMMRDRLDDIEDRLTGLELEVRDAPEELARNENPMAELSELTGLNITIRFERNATRLEPDQRVLLNEVFEQLARAPGEKVLITGYTDRSGDPTVNLRLSEERAKAVRAYLLQRGIDAGRLLVNYYGDSRSDKRDPGERRVEIEWLR